MEDSSRKDIRRILKTFGIQADEAVVAHLARNPGRDVFRIRITLEDLTDYAGSPLAQSLSVILEDEIRR